MKKVFGIILAPIILSQSVLALSVNTKDWVNKENILDVDAVEMDFKSDLKNDFKIYQTTLTNKTGHTIDIIIPSNKTAKQDINSILKDGLTLSDLMALPKEIAVERSCVNLITGDIFENGDVVKLSALDVTILKEKRNR